MKPLTQLKNGATVIAYSEPDHVALCVFNGEYVTWFIDSAGGANWGHYYQSDFNKAATGFAARCSIA